MKTEQPEPPWIRLPRSEPTDGAWRQGPDEVWLLEVWLPFWCGADHDIRLAYVEENQPPEGSFWREYLFEVWSQGPDA